jgi:2-polyprenyl-3-methyl-5-hydroxy-6-metoxy-1,4-benzoquinol methylase
MSQHDVALQMESLAQRDDVWDTQSTAAKQTYAILLGFMQKLFDEHLLDHSCSILEVGCTEGRFTKMLTDISSHVTAIDVSQTAVDRAKMTAPKANILHTSFEDMPEHNHFDVIICSEVLYYMPDTSRVLRKLQHMGKFLLTSNFIADVPVFSLKSILWEMRLQRFPLLDRVWEHDLLHGVLGVKSLRDMRASEETN